MTKHSLTTKTLFTLLTQPGRHRPQRQHRFHKPARFNSDGIALPAAMFMVLAIIVASLVMTTRSLGIWSRSNATSDSMAAKDAAEFGHTKIISQLNHDDKAYLLVTKFENWNSVSSSDLSSCEINASPLPSTTTDALAGVSTNTRRTKTEPVGDSTTQAYSLTAFTAPEFATTNGASNATSNNSTICSSTTSAGKFGNLLGGSAMLTVTGTVTRNGREAAKYVLKRSVHVKFPNQAIANSIVLLGNGSQLKSLNGRICQTAVPPTSIAASNNPCSGLPLTTIASADLEDSICWNVDGSCKGDYSNATFNDFFNKKIRNKYCKNTTYLSTRRYKKNIPCNQFQQLLGMPNFPKLGDSSYPDPNRPKNYTYKGTNKYESIDYTCVDDIAKCEITAYYYSSFFGVNYLSNQFFDITSGRNNYTSLRPFVDFSQFPFKNNINLDTLRAPNLSQADLLPGCFYDNIDPTKATAINCKFNKIKSSKADLAVQTKVMPVNIWMQGTSGNPDIDLDQKTDGTQGGIYNVEDGEDDWKNLRIFGYNNPNNKFSDATNYTPDIEQNSNQCGDQTISVAKARNRGRTRTKDNDAIIDGAIMWFPNATLNINSLNAKSSPYLVIWVCKLIGPATTGKGNISAIFTPLSRLGANAGISGIFNITGGVIRNSYRAYGSKGTTTDDN
jgi:hypothetical protein